MNNYTLSGHLSSIVNELAKLEKKIDKEICKGNFVIENTRFSDDVFKFKIKDMEIEVFRIGDEDDFKLFEIGGFSRSGIQKLSLKASKMIRKKIIESKEVK